MDKLASKFIKSNAIQELNDGKKSFSQLDLSLEYQKDDDLFIGWFIFWLTIDLFIHFTKQHISTVQNGYLWTAIF